MLQEFQLRVDPETAYTPLKLSVHISSTYNLDVNRIKRVDIVRRSIDARQRRVMVNLNVRVHLDRIEPTEAAPCPQYVPVPQNAPQVIVVGAGPAGLFAALRLIEGGVRPIILERGKDVDSRRLDMARISRESIVDPDSNYCFGEGGAGAFSDGKLYTRSKKRGSVDKVLAILNRHGAPADILVDAHPHIGSDKLPSVIKSIRHTIIDCGGEVHFGTRVTDLVIKDGKVTGAITADGTEYSGPVILATGHSARDIYHMLVRRGVQIEAKGIAVGVRLEHPQADIDRIFYHNPAGRGKYLPPAEYSLLTRVDDRAVYSFCMCPGGYIIPAASAPGEIVVNGMSPSGRSTRWANSGMVVEILPEDIPGDSPLRVMEYQKQIENRFFAAADGTQHAPAQRITDFIDGRTSADVAATSYTAGVKPGRVDTLLPEPVASRLKKAFTEFGRKYKGFVTPRATVIGDETRTSAPVRMTRDGQTLQHISFSGLYPCGEGAGYAGGIVSAAIDGDRCAASLIETI